MSFEDELMKIHLLLDQYHQGGISNTNPLLKQYLLFLNAVEKEFKVGDYDQKEYLKKEVTRLVERVQEELNLLTKRLGMTIDEAQERCDNPDNFTSEGWNSIHSLQSQIGAKMKTLIPMLTSESSKPTKTTPPKKKKKPPLVPRSHRKKWLSS